MSMSVQVGEVGFGLFHRLCFSAFLPSAKETATVRKTCGREGNKTAMSVRGSERMGWEMELQERDHRTCTPSTNKPTLQKRLGLPLVASVGGSVYGDAHELAQTQALDRGHICAHMQTMEGRERDKVLDTVGITVHAKECEPLHRVAHRAQTHTSAHTRRQGSRRDQGIPLTQLGLLFMLRNANPSTGSALPITFFPSSSRKSLNSGYGMFGMVADYVTPADLTSWAWPPGGTAKARKVVKNVGVSNAPHYSLAPPQKLCLRALGSGVGLTNCFTQALAC